MHPDKSLRISKCMKRMEEAQRPMNPQGQLNRSDLMKAAVIMEEMGALSEEGALADQDIDTESLPKAGMLLIEVGEEPELEEVEEETGDDDSQEGGLATPDILPALFELHDRGIIEVKDREMLDFMRKTKDLKDKAKGLDTEVDKVRSVASSLASRVFGA